MGKTALRLCRQVQTCLRCAVGAALIGAALAGIAGCSAGEPSEADANNVSAANASNGEAAANAASASSAGQQQKPGEPSVGLELTADGSSFVTGNLVFVAFHELGHALVSELDLPLLGREEDAVDQFATYLLIPDGSDPEDDASILTSAISGWFATSAANLDEIPWWDEHGPDLQRAYQIACLLYGSNPRRYRALADDIRLPVPRRLRCPDEFRSVERGWMTLLRPHMVEDGAAGSGKLVVSYAPAGDLTDERDFLQQREILESMADEIPKLFALPRDISVVAARCNQPNAFWDRRQARLTLCYELVSMYQKLFEAVAASQRAKAKG